MFTRIRRLAVAAVGTAVLTMTPLVAEASAPTTEAAAATITTVRTFDRSNVVFHRDGNPRKGSIQVNIEIQEGRDVKGTRYYRVVTSVAKVKLVARVQIDRVLLSTYGGSTPGGGLNVQGPMSNSGTQGAAASVSDWFDMTELGPRGDLYSTNAIVFYSVRWTDGTLAQGTWAGNDTYNYNTGTPAGKPSVLPSVDASGSIILAHYGDPALGSIKISAGIRVYSSAGRSTAMQPFATVSKGSKVQRVQIDHIEALGFAAYDAPYQDFNVPRAWPYNSATRSSGTASSTSLSTAITPVNPDGNDLAAAYKVAVYWSVRWSDGTLTVGVFLTPLSTLGYSFPNGQANPVKFD